MIEILSSLLLSWLGLSLGRISTRLAPNRLIPILPLVMDAELASLTMLVQVGAMKVFALVKCFMTQPHTVASAFSRSMMVSVLIILLYAYVIISSIICMDYKLFPRDDPFPSSARISIGKITGQAVSEIHCNFRRRKIIVSLLFWEKRV